jgi:hypothetical protein
MTARDGSLGLVTTMLRGPTTVGSSVDTASIDMSTHAHALFHITSTVTSGKALAVTLYDSDDNSNFSAVAALDTVNFAVDSSSITQTILVASRRTRRYVRLRLAGTSSPATCVTVTQLNAHNLRFDTINAKLL